MADPIILEIEGANPPVVACDSVRKPPSRRSKRHANWPYRTAWIVIIALVAAYVGIGTLVSNLHGSRFHVEHDWSTALVARSLDATFAMWFVAVGASIGSFLNVVAYRLPLGRTLGGSSGCPYCCTPIAGSDNIPVLAWLKLRGRCRTCHLPISPQYPLIELLGGSVFLFVFLTEFARAGANLPGLQMSGHGFGVAWTNVSFSLSARICEHLFITSGLIGAAIIAVKGKTVPMKLYAWLVVPIVVATFFLPSLIIVPWSTNRLGMADLESRLDSIVTIVCGLAGGIAIARILAPLIYGPIDRTLIGLDRATTGARQWIGALGVAGASVGWQTVCQVALCSLICQLAGQQLFKRWGKQLCLGDATVWTWLGLVLVRALWKNIQDLDTLGFGISPVFQYLLVLSVMVPIAWLVGMSGKSYFRPQVRAPAIDVPVDDAPMVER